MEKRKAKRKGSVLSAEVYTRSMKVIAGGADNECADGVCLQVQDELKEGDVVGVSMFPVDDGIEDPDSEPINVPAYVVWCEKESEYIIRAGLRFVDLQNL